MRHIIAMFLQNEAGSLSRVANLFSTRGYNIESLAVAPTLDPELSRVTLVTTGDDAMIGQLVSQVRKLIDVVEVIDLTRGEHCERELVLVTIELPADDTDAASEAVATAGGRILSRKPSQLVAEITGDEIQIAIFLDTVKNLGVISSIVRSGILAI